MILSSSNLTSLFRGCTLISTILAGTVICSKTNGYPDFGNNAWYALSMAFKIVLSDITRLLTIIVCQIRVLFNNVGFDTTPSI